jgi:hypothetical protein
LDSNFQPYLFIDVLQRSVGVLAVANTMTPHTCLASVLLAFDQHLGFGVMLRVEGRKRVAPDDRKRSNGLPQEDM